MEKLILEALFEFVVFLLGATHKQASVDRVLDYTICDDDVVVFTASKLIEGYKINNKALDALADEHSKVQFVLNHTKRIRCVFEDAPINFTFKTQAEGASLPNYLVERFPNEMSLILQYEFRITQISKQNFEIIVYFDGRKELLKVPYSALTYFSIGRNEARIDIIP